MTGNRIVLGCALILTSLVVFVASRLTVRQELVGNPTALTAGSIKTALDQYRVDHGHYPPLEFNLDDLAVGHNGSRLERPYLTGLPRDGWGHPFRYKLSSGKPKVFSAGPDGTFDTTDDIYAGGFTCRKRYVFR